VSTGRGSAARLRELVHPSTVALLAGVFLIAIVGTWCAESMEWVAPERRALRTCSVGLGLVAFVCWLALGTSGRLRFRAVEPISLVLVGIAFALVIAEGASVLLARTSSATIFLAAGGAQATLSRNRMPPYALYAGSHLNGGGFHDDAFVASSPDRPVVAVLADSFGLGIVPRAANFIQVAEDRLRLGQVGSGRRVLLHDFGVPAIGVPEYALLLETEVAATAPDLVIVCLFPSNDLESVDPLRRVRWSLGRWLIIDLSRRVGSWLAEELRSSDRWQTPLASVGPAASGRDLAPSLLRPTLSEETFLRIERARLRGLDPRDPTQVRRIDRLIGLLESMRGSQPAAVQIVMIPDEFQVSDPLYRDLVRTDPALADFDRNALHHEIRGRLRSAGFRVLDLLDALRAAEAVAPTYHLRDTHWNEWGNRVAGEALARFVDESLPQEGARGESVGAADAAPDWR
jgi:hypothetical protein